MDTTNSQRGSRSDLMVSEQKDEQFVTHDENREGMKDDKMKCLERENHSLHLNVLTMHEERSELLHHDTHTSVSKDLEATLRSQVASLQNMLEQERRRHAARESELRSEIERLRLALGEQLARVDSLTPQMIASSSQIRADVQSTLVVPVLTKTSTDAVLDGALANPIESKSIRSSSSSLKTFQTSGDAAISNPRIALELPQKVSVDDDADTLTLEEVSDVEKSAKAVKGDSFDSQDPRLSSNGSVEQPAQGGSQNAYASNQFVAPSSGFGDAYRVMCWTASRRDERRRRLRQIADTESCSNSHEKTSTLSPYPLHFVSSAPSGADEGEGADGIPRRFTLQDSNISSGVPLSPYGPAPLMSTIKPPPHSHNAMDQNAKLSVQQNNPNQIGVEILDEKDRTWYTKEVLCMALLSAIPPKREISSLVDVATPTATSASVEVGSIHSPNSYPNEVVEQHDRDVRPGLDLCNDKDPLKGSFGVGASCFSLRSYSLSECSSSSHDSDTILSLLKSAKAATDDRSMTACQVKKSVPEAVPFENMPATTPTASLETPLLYKDVNPQALQRAIEETLSFHFHCAGNTPVMTPGLQPPKEKKPLRAFAQDNNTDPNLLAAFSPFHRALGAKKIPNDMDLSPPETGRYRDDQVCIHYHAPVIFNQIRSFLGLNTDVLRSALKDSTWRQSMSPGKSGTMLFFFGDFVMKTVRKCEFAFLCQRFLPGYVQYCERNPHTLLPRFFALMTIKWLKLGVTKRLILMQNVFTTRYYIHRLYDVKGSTVGRNALQPGKEPARTAYGALLLKDNDLPPQLMICGPYQRAILIAQLRLDVGFLKSLNIVDYSCMIGVRSRFFPREEGPSKTTIMSCKNPTTYVTTTSLMERVDAGVQPIKVGATGHQSSTLELPVSAPSANHRNGQSNSSEASPIDSCLCVCLHGCDGGLLSLPIYAPDDDTIMREEVYYIGLIDVLQEYNSTKKLENFARGFVNDRTQLSVVPPKEYAERLCRVIERITV
ncbi:unnamed protein product [Phytomonas sp. EM1]|nr:unnamed protein product [Phytomonas sp. EM1]|eukprot:CCW64755.1 unnamed protein product [Phytomonas sp. isolate EM1]